MLVHTKLPKGIMHLAGFRIYGKDLGRDPTDIPFVIYNTCKDGLHDGTYREGFLSRCFGKQFPEIAFTYHEMRWLPENTLNIIGPLMVADYNAEWSHKKKVDQLKLAIVSISPQEHVIKTT